MKLGRLKLDLSSQILMDQDGKEVTIEQKSLELLVYLIENTERYVSMQELHENLWSDRIVTDSAIRQSISKLRKVLGDTADSATYIRSVPKKGYRFVYQSEEHSKSNDIAERLSSEPLIKTDNRLKRNYKLPFFTPIVVLVVYLVFGNISVTTKYPLSNGNSVHLTTDNNKDFVYVSQLADVEKYKIWVKKSGIDALIEQLDHQVLFPVKNNDKLYLGWNKANQCGLYTYTNLAKEHKTNFVLPNCSKLTHLSGLEDELIISFQSNEKNVKQSQIIRFSPKNQQTKTLLAFDTPLNGLKAIAKNKGKTLIVANSSNRLTVVKTYQQRGENKGFTQVSSNSIGMGVLKQLRGNDEISYLLFPEAIYSLKDQEFTLLHSGNISSDISLVNENFTLLSSSDKTRYQLYSQSRVPSNNNALVEPRLILPDKTTSYYGQSLYNAYYVIQGYFSSKIVHMASGLNIYDGEPPLSILHYDLKRQWLVLHEKNSIVVFDTVSKTQIDKLPIDGHIASYSDNHQDKLNLMLVNNNELQYLSYDYTEGKTRELFREDLINSLSAGTINSRLLATLHPESNIPEGIDLTGFEQPIFTENGIYFTKVNINFSELHYLDINNNTLEKVASFDTPVSLYINDKNTVYFYAKNAEKNEISIVNLIK